MKTLLRRLFAPRVLVWGVISVVTVYLLLVTCINWTGARAWSATKTTLEKDGETVDFKALLPMPLPAESNLFEIDDLKGISVAKGSTSPEAKRLEALTKMKWPETGSKVPRPNISGVSLGTKPDLAAWLEYASASKYLSVDTKAENKGRELLHALDEQMPIAKRIADAAATCTRGDFVPALSDRELPVMLYALELPGYTGAQNAARALYLRALAAADSGDDQAATSCIRALLCLSEAPERDPTLIGELVAVSISSMATDGLWALLEKRAATDTELADLTEMLGKRDHLASVIQAMRGELALGVNTMDYLMLNKRQVGNMIEVINPEASRDAGSPAFALLARGFFEHSKSVLAGYLYESSIQPLKARNFDDLQKRQIKGEAELKEHHSILHPAWIFTCLSAPATSNVTLRVFAHESVRRQSLIAVALERWFLQHQSYPASLSELVPSLLPMVPADPMDGKPMRYRLTPAGRYALWSIGCDGKDDQGKVTEKTNANHLYKAAYQGDWAWQYEAVK